MEIFQFIFGFAAVFAMAAICVMIPIGMAERRNRSPLAWLLVSLLLSPVVAIIGLLLLGGKE